MTKLTAAEQFDIAIKSAASDAETKATSREIAEEFYREQPELVEHFRDAWICEKLAVLIAKHRLALRRASNQQLQFEGLLGFKSLPQKVVLKSGEKMRREEATIRFFREHRAMLWKKKSPGLEQADKAIALMEKYTKREPDITWGEVVRREAEKKH